MIKNQTFVCIALSTWESEFLNTLVKMMTLLSRENKVLFVDYEYTLKDLITRNPRVPVSRVIGLEPRLRTLTTEYGSQVHVLTPPPVLPVNWIKPRIPYRSLLKLNGLIVKASIQSAMKTLGIKDPVVVNGYNPFFGLTLAGNLNEKLHIYYCYDEIKGDQWYSFHGPSVEEDYIKKTDAVITTSDALHESKGYLHRKCYVVKNGVDFENFQAVADFTVKSPHQKKVVGYTGSLDERFDTETMVYTISRLPEVEFRFLGRITNEEAKNRLTPFSNVIFLGSARPDEVPQYLKEVDVAIIPYIKSKVTRGVYPLKINEYLAAAKPVVMTDFAPLPEFTKVVRTAESKEQFLNYLREELYADNYEKKKLRVEFARKNSWENRVKEFSVIIEKLLTQKPEKVA
ncbi:MAG TPA: glycosyltransferase [Cytophagaceae bacterium]